MGEKGAPSDGFGRVRKAVRHSKTDGDPVPCVDRADREAERDLHTRAELRLDFGMDVIRCPRGFDPRQCFRPSKCGGLARGMDRRPAPGIQQVKAFLSFTVCARVLPMHVDAARAAIDLRSAQVHRFNQAVLSPLFSSSFSCASIG